LSGNPEIFNKKRRVGRQNFLGQGEGGKKTWGYLRCSHKKRGDTKGKKG